jgi:hypothetical protein
MVRGLDRWRKGLGWSGAQPGLGKYSFREWHTPVKLAAGAHEPKVRAVNLGGVWIGAGLYGAVRHKRR